jgi:hypothetical protein
LEIELNNADCSADKRIVGYGKYKGDQLGGERSLHKYFEDPAALLSMMEVDEVVNQDGNPT